VNTLFDAAYAGDAQAEEALLRLMSDDDGFAAVNTDRREEERAGVAAGLGRKGNSEAFAFAVARATGQTLPPEGHRAHEDKWLGALVSAREQFPLAEPLLGVIANGGRNAEQAARIAEVTEGVDDVDLMRALLRGQPTLARHVIRAHLAEDPEATTAALRGLANDHEVSMLALGVLGHVEGVAGRDPEAIRFAAHARTVLGHLPGREDAAALEAQWQELEGAVARDLRFGGLVGSFVVGSTQLSVTLDGGVTHLPYIFEEESTLILEVTGPGGRVARATATSSDVQPGDQPTCPTPVDCYHDSDSIPGPHVTFDHAHPAPLFDRTGEYQVRIVSTYGAVSWGPVELTVRR